jgi:hypothetical protein
MTILSTQRTQMNTSCNQVSKCDALLVFMYIKCFSWNAAELFCDVSQGYTCWEQSSFSPMTSYHIHCTGNVHCHMSALSLGVVQNQYSQAVPMQHTANEHYAVSSQCSIVQTVHPFWYHCLELWWSLLMNCGWQVSFPTLLLMQRVLSVQWHPVFHQIMLSALFHRPMRLSFNQLMYLMLSEVTRTRKLIPMFVVVLFVLLIMNIETVLHHVHRILQ